MPYVGKAKLRRGWMLDLRVGPKYFEHFMLPISEPSRSTPWPALQRLEPLGPPTSRSTRSPWCARRPRVGPPRLAPRSSAAAAPLAADDAAKACPLVPSCSSLASPRLHIMDDGRRQYRLSGRRRFRLARQYTIQSRDKQRSRPTPPLRQPV